MIPNTEIQPVITSQPVASQMDVVNFAKTIENDDLRLTAKEMDLEKLIEELGDITRNGLMDDDGIEHKGLDDMMWDEIQKRVFEGFPKLIAMYLGVQGKEANINVLGMFYEQYEELMRIERGTKTIARDVQQFGKVIPTEAKNQPKPQEEEQQPITMIQRSGKALPNVDALSLGDKDDRVSWLMDWMDEAAVQWEKYYLQSCFGGDERKRWMLQRINRDLREGPIKVARGICMSAFEIVRSMNRQLMASLAKSQMAQNMWIPPMERQRRETAWGYVNPAIKDADLLADEGEKRQIAESRRSVKVEEDTGNE